MNKKDFNKLVLVTRTLDSYQKKRISVVKSFYPGGKLLKSIRITKHTNHREDISDEQLTNLQKEKIKLRNKLDKQTTTTSATTKKTVSYIDILKGIAE